MHPAEILFTVFRNKIIVIDEDTNKKLDFTELLHRLSAETPNLWTNFIVFKDLRTRGFIIKIEKDRFLIYERGTYRKTPPSYVIHIFSEGKPQSLTVFIEELKAAENDGYEMKVAPEGSTRANAWKQAGHIFPLGALGQRHWGVF